MKSLLLCAFIFTFFYSTSVKAEADMTKFNQAAALLVIEQEDTAIDIINNEIKNNPTDADVLFKAGQFFERIGDEVNAVKNYMGAAKLNGEYKEIVDRTFLSIGTSMAIAGRNDFAIEIFARKHSLAPQTMQPDIEMLLTMAGEYLDGAQDILALNLFIVVENIDKSASNEIAETYYQAGAKPDNPQFDYLHRSIKYKPEIETRIIDFLKQLAQNEDTSTELKNKIKAELHKWYQ